MTPFTTSIKKAQFVIRFDVSILFDGCVLVLFKTQPPKIGELFQKKLLYASFFQVTIWSPKWRSLSPWKGHE